MEIDTITEVMNISMGSAATAASTLLDYKTTITTPVEKVSTYDEFQIDDIESKVAIKIPFIEGVSGSIIVLIKSEDVRTIISLMDIEVSDDFEIDEMVESALCELMNQMMGSSATVLSCFLGRSINIFSPDEVFIGELESFKHKYFNSDKDILSIDFSFNIADHFKSSLSCLMETELAKEIIDISLSFDGGCINDDCFNYSTSQAFDYKHSNENRNRDCENIVRFSREQLRVISTVYDDYSKVLSFYFSTMTRSLVEVECVHIEEQRYSEFNNALPDSIVAGIGEIRFADTNEHNSVVMMDFSKSIMVELVNRIFDKSNKVDAEYGYDYCFNDVELTTIENLFRCLFSQMSDTWFNHLEFDAIYREVETNSRSISVIAPDEHVVLIMLDVKVNDMQGCISICIPAKAFLKIKPECARKINRANCAENLYRYSNIEQYLKVSGIKK